MTKDTLKPLIKYFNSYLPLDDKETAELENSCQVKKVKRRQFILTPGEFCKFYTFIVEGCFKMYKVDEAAKEHNIVFAVENDWIVDFGSFYGETASQLYIEAIEPSIIIQIPRNHLYYLFTEFPKFNRNFRVIIENKFIEMQNRLLQTISTTAEERYLAFQENYPQLINRLPSTQIASYIGITPEFLSRIRGNMSRQ